MKLYTKTGDKGDTGLIGGTRVSKTDVRLEAYGTIDELNAFVGLLATSIKSERHLKTLQAIQNKLFSIGSYLATDQSVTQISKASIVTHDDCLVLETEMDNIMLELPPIKAFVLPGGLQVNAICHVCRTVTRRAERRILELNKTYQIDEQILIYVNRLSDYFFALSRHLTFKTDVEEIYWKAHD